MSLHSAVLSVHIPEPPARGFYTDADEVAGYVTVEVHRELNVAQISAQLRCEDRGRAYSSENRDVVDLSHWDETNVLWKSEVVEFALHEFSPSRSPQHEDARHLPKGTYRFPFQFVLPTRNSRLPSSYRVEANHDFNGTFWGVAATIDRGHRNYADFGEFKMLPHRERVFDGADASLTTAIKSVQLRLHRRPSFMLGEGMKHLQKVEGWLGAPSGGLIQSRGQDGKQPAGQDIKIQLRVDENDEPVVLSEITLFVDTEIMTNVQGHKSGSKTVAIAFSTRVSELVEAGGWRDMSHYISHARIYGLVETFSTAIHKYTHTLRVQFEVAPQSKASWTSILEVSVPLKLYSEGATSRLEASPPPAYPHA